METRHPFRYMKKISRLIGDALRASNAAFALNFGLAKSWEHIAGEDLKGLSSFESAVYAGKGRIIVTIKILSSAAILAKYNEPSIIERIQHNFKLNYVKIIFKHTSEIKTINKFSKKSDNLKTERYVLNERFENGKLKSALENLKTELVNAA